MDRKDAKDFVEHLAKKRQNWIDANRENDFEEGMKRWLAQQYPDNAHFIYELLQNAEDAHATHIYFRLEDNRFITEHDGCPFTKENVKGITGIGNTTKSDQPNAIGKFGIGFKAVFQYTNTPEVYSYPFSFKITDLVLPECLDSEGTSSKSVTRFAFPFDNPQKEPDQAFDEIAEGLLELSVTTLLFLQNIKRISWHIEPDIDDYIERENSSTYLIDIRRQGKDDFTRWLLFEKKSREKPDKSIAVAFCYEDHHASESSNDLETTLKKGPQIRPVEPGKLCIFFPAAKETTGLRFHIHAPFASTPDRASINHKDQGNESLRDQLADLFVESLATIRDAGLLNTQFLEVLPNNKDHLDPFFRPFLSKVLEAFKKHAYTPKASGGHAPSQILYSGLRNLRDLFNDADLTLLLEKECAWAAGVMQNTRGHYFLESLNLTELELNSLLAAVGEKFDFPFSTDEIAKSWLLSKKPDFLAKFYLLYEDYEKMPKIVLSDDRELYRPHRIYLLPEDSSFTEKETKCLATYPKVDTQILKGNKQRSQKLREVLCDHGVNILGEEQIVEYILDKYYSGDSFPSDKMHITHINKFIKFWTGNKSTSVFLGYDFLRGNDDNFHSVYKLYVDLPYKKTGLSCLYENEEKILLSNKYKKVNSLFLDFVVNLGVQDSILPIKCRFSAYFNPYIYDEIKNKKLKKTKVDNRQDFNFRIPYEILPKNDDWDKLVHPSFDKFNACPQDFGFNFQKSKLLWIFMCRLSREYLYAIYDLNKSTCFKEKSTIIVFLEKMKWIPDKKGNFHIPKDMTRDILHDEFTYNNDSGWLDLIGFSESAKQAEEQKNEVQRKNREEKKQLKILLRKHCKVSPEIIDELMDSLSKMTPEEQHRLIISAEATSRKRHASDTVKNPERRIAKSASSHLENPERADELRQRTIRTTAPELIARKTYLKSTYLLNDDGNDVEINWCQLCGKGLDEVSFLTDDNSFYFESVEIFPKGTLSKENAAASLLLCPLCSAKYRVLVKKDKAQQEQLLDWFKETALNHIDKAEPLRFPVHVNNQQHTIKFAKSHFCDIQGILIAESNRNSSSFSMEESEEDTDFDPYD